MGANALRYILAARSGVANAAAFGNAFDCVAHTNDGTPRASSNDVTVPIERTAAEILACAFALLVLSEAS
jgi:hypothetical protein